MDTHTHTFSALEVNFLWTDSKVDKNRQTNLFYFIEIALSFNLHFVFMVYEQTVVILW